MYRIYTEDKNRKGIIACAATLFDGFTALPATGYWKGEKENALILEFDTEDANKVHALAENIRLLNHQEAVLVTYAVSSAKYVTGVPEALVA